MAKRKSGAAQHNLFDEKGSATAEVAIVFPVIIFLLVVIITLFSAGSSRLKCIDAAREVARIEISQDNNKEDPQEVASKIVGGKSQVSVSKAGDWINVRVETPIISSLSNFFPLTVCGEAKAKVSSDEVEG